MSIGQEESQSKISENQGHDAISTVQVKLIVFLAQALLALTRIPMKPAYDIETKFTSDAM